MQVFSVRVRLESPQPKPEKLIGSHRQQIGKVADARKHVPAKHFNRNIPFKTPKIQFYSLRSARKIVNYQHHFVAEPPHVSQYPMFGRIQELYRSPAEYSRRLANS